jgi:hypothetical protein
MGPTLGGVATHRPKVKPDMKNALLAEAGYQCANPGCERTLVQYHHIREWAVWQTHDAEHMIALSAGCHDEVHRGDLSLDDAT